MVRSLISLAHRARRWLVRLACRLGRRLGVVDESTADLSEFSRREWRRVARESFNAVFERRLITLSGGVAFYATMALLPTTAGLLAVISRTLSPDEAQVIIDQFSHYLPEELARFARDQLPQLTDQKAVSLSAVLVAGLLALWAGSGAMDNLMNALNAAYGLKERRSPWRFKSTSLILMFTTVGLVSLIIGLTLISVDGLIGLGITPVLAHGFNALRWLSVLLLISAIVLIIYRFAPNHHRPRIKWMSWGAVIATISWLLATAAFFVYVQFVADLSQAFGVLAGMFVVMIWLEFTSLILIVGATINGRLTHHAIRIGRRQQ